MESDILYALSDIYWAFHQELFQEFQEFQDSCALNTVVDGAIQSWLIDWLIDCIFSITPAMMRLSAGILYTAAYQISAIFLPDLFLLSDTFQVCFSKVVQGKRECNTP